MNDKSFNNWEAMTDRALAKHIGAFVRHHRLQQNKSQDELASAAGVSRSTLSLLERGETVTVNTLIRVLRMLEQLHILDAFSVETVMSPILLAKMNQQKRQRATGKPGNDKNKNKRNR